MSNLNIYVTTLFVLSAQYLVLLRQKPATPPEKTPVEDRKMMCTQGLRDYDSIYSLKILAHFRSKVLEDFPHYVTQINCLTGAIISETYTYTTHITNEYI